MPFKSLLIYRFYLYPFLFLTLYLLTSLHYLISRMSPSLELAQRTYMVQFNVLTCSLSCQFSYNTCVENAHLFYLDWYMRMALSVRIPPLLMCISSGRNTGECRKLHPAELSWAAEEYTHLRHPFATSGHRVVSHIWCYNWPPMWGNPPSATSESLTSCNSSHDTSSNVREFKRLSAIFIIVFMCFLTISYM